MLTITGEAFHPHSVGTTRDSYRSIITLILHYCLDIEWRHDFYQVVKSNTECKKDFAVKSVSEFIAAR